MKSMTGFGRAKGEIGGKSFEIIVSSLNHRFIEISTSLPETFECWEVPIRMAVKKKLRRGKIFVKVNVYEGEEMINE